ncbi:MAG: LPS export ABC transporter periplasmic protein LptC [Candidatus Omnitrophica bacterium]|nr:LPS export ABC transporter periplasmic protein LptC [Candidatus Omnitrophota bacterium]
MRYAKRDVMIFPVLFCFIAACVCGCSNRSKDAGQDVTAEDPATLDKGGTGKSKIKISAIDEEQKILSFDMTGFTNDGKKKWDIRGNSADIISDTVLLKDIEANAYSKDRTVNLKAKSGEYDKKKNAIKLEDNVLVATSDGISLATEWLEWESESDVIHTDSFVQVKRGNFYASGTGASVSTKYREVQVDSIITVRQGQIVIECRGPLTIDYGRDKASFYGSVKVTEPRGELMADRLDIFFDPDSREIEEVIAENNVRLIREDNVAKGDKIVYTVASGQAVLTGSPEILINSQRGLEDALVGD